MADEPLLGRGDEGEWVSYLQRLLTQVRAYAGAIDGIFGAATEQSVRNFQSRCGLDPDGSVAAPVWKLLVGDLAGPGGGASDRGPGGDVPVELVQAGAPARLSAWSDEQKAGYFQGTGGDDVGGDPPEQLEAAAIEHLDEQDGLA